MATDFDLVLSSLIGCVVNTGQNRLRIQTYSEITLSPVHCGSLEDFEINLRRSIIKGYDNYDILRVNIHNYTEGVGHCDCGIPKTIPEMFNSLFGEDNNGNVYVNIANISGNTGTITITKIIL
jgi:hypothetical protein